MAENESFLEMTPLFGNIFLFKKIYTFYNKFFFKYYLDLM